VKEWNDGDGSFLKKKAYIFWQIAYFKCLTKADMEKCSFIKEGTVRQGKMVSVYCDYNIYGMLRDDYIGMQGM
jgi:hypothetical protein